MKQSLLFALLTFTFFDILPQSQSSELKEVHQYVLSINTTQERIEIEDKYIEVYRDSTNSLTYEEISAKFLMII